MFAAVSIAEQMDAESPASVNTIVRWAREQPLDFTPGSRFAYSNLGYAILGRVIEEKSGQNYEEYVQGAVLHPAGITRMEIGRTLPSERPDDEFFYHPNSAESPITSVFNDDEVPRPDGGFHLEAMDAHGGWIASTTDLLRFIAAVDGRPSPPDILSSNSIAEMTAQSAHFSSTYWYGFGWLVRPMPWDLGEN